MPSRIVAARELAELFKLVAHPDRIRLVEELGTGEQDVNTLVETLHLPGPRVSQHLSLLRAHRLVQERREGRHRYYSLSQPEIAVWIVNGLTFIQGRLNRLESQDIDAARHLWGEASGISHDRESHKGAI